MAGNNDLFPGPGGGMNGLTPFGDPEAYTAAAASTAMEPIIGPYLKSVFTGQNAYDWANRNFGPNANSFDTAMELGLSLGPGAIGGARSATANISALRQMEAMENQWPSPTRQQIYDTTKWYRGEGNEPLYNISPEGARLRTENLRQFEVASPTGGDSRTFHMVPFGKDLTLGDIYDYPNLYEAYPHMKDVKVRPEPANSKYGGYVDPLTDTLYLQDGEEATLLTRLAHETTHLTERYEYWPKGGDPEEFLPPGHTEELNKVAAQRQDVADQLVKGGYSPMMISMEHGIAPYGSPNIGAAGASRGVPADLLNSYMDLSQRHYDLFNMSQEANQMYRNLAGEVKARVAEAHQATGVWDKLPEQIGEWRAFIGGGGKLEPYTPSSQQIVQKSGRVIVPPVRSGLVLYNPVHNGYHMLEEMPEGFVPQGVGQ